MANEVVKVTEVTNVITASLNDGSFNLLAGGTIGGNLQLGGTLTVGENDLGHDVKFFGATSGKYLQWDESADKLIIAGDLDVTGTTTSFNSTVVTIDDPVFTIGGDTAPSSDDNKDRGIEFRYHDGSTPRVGFFGYDDSESAFTFLTSATNSSEVFSGTLGNLKVNTVYHGDGTASSPSVRFNLDSDTGIFRPTANNLAFTTGGTEVARFDSSGDFKLLNNFTIESTYPRINLTDTNNNSDYSIINNDGSFGIFDVTNGAYRFSIDSNGLITVGGTGGGALTIGSHIDLGDNQKVRFGTNDDLQLYHNGTNSYITNGTGDLIIYNSADDKDIVFQSDDGSGGIETYFRLDGSLSGGDPITVFPDNSTLQMGDGGAGDLRILHDGTNSFIKNHSGNLTIQNRADDKDIIFSCDDGSGGNETYFFLDGSVSSGNPFTVFPDLSELAFGTGRDLRIKHDGADSIISNNSGDLYIRNKADDKDVIFESDNGSGGYETYFFLDGSASSGNPFTVFPDNSILQFGTDIDLYIYSDGSSNSYIKNSNGHLQFIQYATDKDIKFQCDDGSGGVTEYFRLDGSESQTVFEKHIKLSDSVELRAGTGGDSRFMHDGSNTYLDNYTGHFYIRQAAADKDIIFKADDGSGGNETYFYLDGSASSGNPVTNFPDNSALTFGNDRDYWIYHDGTDSRISNYVGDLVIRNYADDKDIVFVSDDGSGNTTTYFRLDGSAAPNPRTTFADNSTLQFGDGGDLQIFHDTADSFIRENTRHLYIQNTANDSDIILATDDGSGGTTEYFRLDGGLGYSVASKAIRFEDNIPVYFGTGADLQLWHDGSNSNILNYTGHLTIKNAADDKDIIFQSDDGAGGTTDYLRLDGSDSIMKAHKKLRFLDNVKGTFGNADDLQIFHDGTHSKITNNVTGSLYIQSHNSIQIESGNGEDMITCAANAGVSLFYDNSKKLETTTDGISLHGNGYIDIPDNGRIRMGASYDFAIYHSSSDNKSVIEEIGSGNLSIRGTNIELNNAANNKTYLLATDGGSVQLRHNDSTKLETTADGIQVTGDILAYTDSGQYFQLDKSDNSLKLSDNVKLKIGTGSDFQIFHTGTNTTMLDQGTGALVIASNNLRVLSANQAETLFEATEDGAVELYHNNVKKFETTAAGVTITGDLTVSGSTNQTFNDLTVNGNLTVSGTTTTIDTANLTVEDKNIIIGNVSSPSDTTADGGGFTLKGASDYTIQWTDATNRWQFNQGIQLDDSSRFVVGSSGDASFYHNGTLTYLENATGDLTIRNLSDGDDIIIQTDNGSGGVENYLQFDGGGRLMRAYRNFRAQDDVKLQAGSAGDLEIKHTSNHSYIDNQTGDLTITNHTDDGDLIFRSDNGSGGVTEYFRLDGALAHSVVSKHIRFEDNVIARFGSGNDAALYHTGSEAILENSTGNLSIKNHADDADIIFQCDDGSGGVTQYFRLDGGDVQVKFLKDLKLEDSVILQIGTGNDLQAYHDGSNSYVTNATGDMYFINSADDKDIVFMSDDGSGGFETYFYLDGSMNTDTTAKTVFPDNSKLQFGSGASDLRIYHDGTDSQIESKTGTLVISNNVDNADVRLQASGGSGSASDYIILDSSQGTIRLKRKTKLDDNLDLCFGDGEDLKIGFDGTNSTISQIDGDMRFIQYTDNKMIRFYNDDGSGGVTEYFRVDGSANNVNFSATAHFVDGVYAAFGGSHDLQIWHDATNSNIQNNTGNLIISNTSDDKDIIFQSDDGSGGTETYFYLDGSSSSGAPFTVFPDESYLAFGSSLDFTIRHNGTDTYISNDTGNLYIRSDANDKDIIFQSDDGSGGIETYFFLDGSVSSGNPYTTFPDNSRLTFGSSRDLQIMHNGTNTVVENLTGNLTFTNYADDKDIIFQSDNNSGGVETYFYLDGSINSADAHTVFPDSSRIVLGSGTDTQLYHDGSNSYISHTGTGDLYIQNSNDDRDIVLQSDDGSGAVTDYLRLDGSTENMRVYKDFLMSTGTSLYLSSIADGLRVHHSGSIALLANGTGNFIFQTDAADSDMIFKADSGTGSSTTEYLRLDGARVDLTVSKSVRLLDGVQIQFGDDVDMNIMHNGANGFITNAKGDLTIKTSEADKDIIFQSDDGSGGETTYFRLDGSYGGAGYPTTVFPTNASCRFGNSGELQIIHTSGHSYISNNATGNLYIRNAAADQDIVFEADDGSGGGNVETYFFCDGSASSGNPYTIFPDNSHLAFGSDRDFTMVHSGTNMAISNKEGDLYIVNEEADKDIIFQADDGSGLIETYFFLDGSKSTGNPYTIFPNSSFLGFGNDGNLLIAHGGASGSASIQNNGGDINITQNTNDGDVTFFNDDGSGSTAMYLSLDGGREIVRHHRGVEYNVQSPNNTDYTVGSSDYCIIMHSLTQSRTVTIPTAQRNAGRVLIIKERDGYASSYSVVIDPEGSTTIDGNANYTISTNKEAVTLISDGSNWFIIGKS